jgi:hypothetical protein
LVFLAMKWRGDDLRCNHYTTIANQPHPHKEELINTRVPAGSVRAAAQACLTIARDGDPDAEAVVLHVTEIGSARESVDISVADAGLTLSDAAPILGPVFDAFDVNGAAFMDAAGSARFGHIAVGTDRSGAPFATLYFGAEQL